MLCVDVGIAHVGMLGREAGKVAFPAKFNLPNLIYNL